MRLSEVHRGLVESQEWPVSSSAGAGFAGGTYGETLVVIDRVGWPFAAVMVRSTRDHLSKVWTYEGKAGEMEIPGQGHMIWGDTPLPATPIWAGWMANTGVYGTVLAGMVVGLPLVRRQARGAMWSKLGRCGGARGCGV